MTLKNPKTKKLKIFKKKYITMNNQEQINVNKNAMQVILDK